jgi:hypothetical protein
VCRAQRNQRWQVARLQLEHLFEMRNGLPRLPRHSLRQRKIEQQARIPGERFNQLLIDGYCVGESTFRHQLSANLRLAHQVFGLRKQRRAD